MSVRNNFLTFKCLLYAVAFITLISCSRGNIVEEHFKAHGMSYPLETSGMTTWKLKHVGIEQDELSAPGARDYIESGLMSIKEHFRLQDPETSVPDAKAIVLSDPVLFRDETGEVGLMVKVAAYGSGKPDRKISLPVKWVGEGKKLWKVENFAYFSRDVSLLWHYKGMVYE